MEMESTRRPTFDRSREPGLKKPRLAAADDQPNPNGRPFPHRPPPSMAALPPASARYRPSNDNDLSTTEAYQPQPQPQLFHELVSQYKTALAELTFNSKPIITNLTIIAGENLHAAKAVAATICANILEVPSDQKLPSLYLLDSIVKNIGRDYIRYFAARLPEVFCKAYRQVDPPVHASMRHLFGTWKGVFPLQTLQLIEKELGFSPAVNGSGAVSSRPDAQAQRPQHSIHVNPKYLERQRLQQSSSRAKGMASDSSLHGTNSTEDDERLDRASGIDVRPWVDPPAKIHNIQHSRRELLSEPLNEKKIGTVYGDFEYGSDVSRNSSPGIGRTGGRVAEPGRDRPWYGAASGITDATAGQRNGLTTKHGFSNHPAPKSSNVGLQLQPTSGIASRSTRIASSWKNSEEEEFMWDMHSRLSEQDAAKISMNSRKDWTPDGSEKLDLDDDLLKARTLHDIGSRFDGETSDYSLSAEQKEAAFGNQLSSPWRLQELQSSDRPIDSGASAPGIGHSDGYSSTLGGLADSAVSSLARLAPRPSLGSSNIGNTGFGFSTAGILGSTGTLAQQRFQSGRTSLPTGQSPMRQPPLSPSFPSHYPQHSAEQNHPQSRSFPQLDYKPPLPSAKLLSANAQLGKGQKLQPEDLKGSSPSGPTFQLGRKYPLSKQLQSISKQSEHSDQQQSQHLHSVSSLLTSLKSETSTSERSNPQATETSGQSSTSSLLAAVMESGILSKLNNDSLPNRSSQDVKQVPSRSNSQPPLRHGPPPSLVTSSGPKVKSASLPTALLHDDASTNPDGSQRTDEPPPLPAGAPPTSTQASEVTSSPISNLLSSLVAKGLISASKSEPSLLLPSQKPSPLQSQKPSITTPDVGSAPAPTVVPQSGDEDDVSPPELDAKPSAALSQQSSVKTENLIGLEFKADVIRELHPPVISVLFEDLPHQCSSCGLWLKIKERLDRHLEWHAWKKAESNDINKLTRRWYVNASDWVAGKAGLPMGIQSSSFIDEVGRMMDEDGPMVPADDDQCVCVLCGELFEDYYSEERNEWMFRGATHMTLPQGDIDVGCMNENLKGPIVHACCIPESSNDNMEIETCVKTEKEA